MPLTPEEITAQQRAVTLNNNIRNAPPQTPPNTPQESLGNVLQDTNVRWQYSDSGAGGALLAIPTGPGSTGAAIKVEHEVKVKQAQKVSQMLDGFLQNAQGTPPFAAPRATVYNQSDLANSPQLAQGVLGHLNQVDSSGFTGFKQDGFDGAKESLQKAGNGQQTDNAVLVMEFAQGTQCNKLPESDKVALLKSEAFAQSFGRAMAPSIALGLSDHLGVSGGGGIDRGAFKSNVSNFMYEPTSGKISVIDFDTGMGFSPDGDLSKSLFGMNDADKRIAEMRTYLENATQNQQTFDAAIDNLINPNGTITPFTPVMKAFWSPDGDNFFDHSQKDAFQQLSEADKRQFAMNLLKGSVDGLEYMQQNQAALTTAAQNTREQVKGTQLDHFYTDQQLQEMNNELGNLQANTLRNNLATMSASHTISSNQKQTNDLTTKLNNERTNYVNDLNQKEAPLQQRLTEVQRKINRIESNPTAGDRFKEAFTRKGHHPVDKLKKEEADLQRQLNVIATLKNDSTNVMVTEPLANLKAQQDFQTNTMMPLGVNVNNNVGVQQNVPQQNVPQLNVPQQNVPTQNVTNTTTNTNTTTTTTTQSPTTTRNVPQQNTVTTGGHDQDQNHESVRSKLSTTWAKNDSTRLKEKVDSEKAGLGHQRNNPRLRDTNPGLVHDNEKDNSQKQGQGVKGFK